MTSRKKVFTRVALLGFCVPGAWLVLTAANCNPGGPYTGGGGAQGPTQEICCDAQVPAGHVLVDKRWDQGRCGNPTTVTLNVCVYQRYQDFAVGTVLTVCSDAPDPPGWMTVQNSERWDPTKCGSPSNQSQKNVKDIRKTS